MDCFEPIFEGCTGAAVEDVQRRLTKLGYDLGEQGIDGVFGEGTRMAVRRFRSDKGMSDGDTIDALTWAALVDASFELGDRTLYLKMPYFHGNDVAQLQQALSILGFGCGPQDSIFGAYTEKAVRDFQANMGIDPDGIVGMATCNAIERLHWAYKDKSPMGVDDGMLAFSRAVEVLENSPICIYGTDEITREIASRVANLAFATTSLSRLSSADSLSGTPSEEMVLVEIGTDVLPEPDGVPVVVFENARDLARRFKIAVSSLSSAPSSVRKRIVVRIAADRLEDDVEDIDGDLRNLIQHFAIQILDAICFAF